MTRSKKQKKHDDTFEARVDPLANIQADDRSSNDNCFKTHEARSRKNAAKSNAVAVMQFTPNEVVWAKLRGHPHWPAKIVTIENNKFEIVWFNDYRKSKVFRSQLYKFHDYLDEYRHVRKIGFEKALKEAILYSIAMSQ